MLNIDSCKLIVLLALVSMPALAAKPPRAAEQPSKAETNTPMQQYCFEQAKHKALSFGDLSDQVRSDHPEVGDNNSKGIAKAIFQMEYTECMESK